MPVSRIGFIALASSSICSQLVRVVAALAADTLRRREQAAPLPAVQVKAATPALAVGLATRQAPGRVALWPAALIPTWFGISHLVAGVFGYRDCPELGAIPSVMLARPVPTACSPWEWIDDRLERCC